MKTKHKLQPIRRIYKYRNSIDLDPAFQREKVWTEKKQQYFIDTILKGWGVPKLYFAVEKNNKDYVCIDGKQRLTSLFMFLSNKLKLNSKFSGLDANKFYKDLTRVKQDAIDDYELSIEEVKNYTEEEISELFKRLQGGSPLNSGENLMAISGDLKGKIKKFTTHPFFKKKVALANKRYAYFTVCAQLVFLELNGIANLSMSSLEKMIKDNKNLSNAGLTIKSKLIKIKKVFNAMEKMFPDKCHYLKNRATIVSFYLLVSELMDKIELQGIQKKLQAFFNSFMKELNAEIGKGVKATNAQLINYQSAVTQGADKQKTISLRRSILLDSLIKFDPSFHKIISPHTDPEAQFDDLYGKFENKFKNSVAVDVWIFSKKPGLKKYNCRKNKPSESLPTHIRHCIHHKKHGKFSSNELKRAMIILNKLKGLIP